MKNGIRKLISVVLCFTLLFSVSSLAFAKSAQSNSKQFKDVKPGHWAYDAIMWMLERSIIDGVGGDRFDPNGIVTRAQFAKMMVNTLNLKKYSPETPSFLDVKKNSWEYPYVESAKPYLTGFRTSSGDYFKPSLAAVREDMAVALVNALGYQGESIDTSILNQFADKDQISPNLRKHVALSVKYGLIVGKTENGRLLFDPQGNLTRAQAAVLLKRAFEKNEEKVTYDEEKVTYDPNTGYTYERPIIELKTENNVQVIRWNRIESDKFREYRVVISKNDDTPQYPDNGYLYTITDRNRTYAVIDNSTKYNGGDFGNYLTKGQTYYISVTAVYSDRNVPGNTVSFVYNGPENPEQYAAPVVNLSAENGKHVLRWNRIDSKKFREYRVVISKNDNTPQYPDNGYLYTITDRNRTYAVIDNTDKYNGGDFGNYLTKGQTYYISVTAVYSDRNVPGNTVSFVYNGPENPEQYAAPVVSLSVENGRHVLRWNRIDSKKFKEYRVVISKNDDTPQYPDNGYLNTITDRNRTYAVIDNSTKYNGGDFGNYLTKGQTYYISVTAVYSDRNVPGNTVSFVYNGTENPELYVAPDVSSSVENGKLVLRWNRIDSPKLTGYIVSASKNDSSITYPENGYLYMINDVNRTYVVIDNSTRYTDGDFEGYFINGEQYYFSVTAVYNDKSVTGNTIRCTYVGEDSPELFPAPQVSAAYEDGKLVVKWNKLDSSLLTEYRVVISEKSDKPAYPANGYYDQAYGKDTTSVVIDSAKQYHNGDFEKLTYATEYYISVTAVYGNKYVAGNAVKILYLINDQQAE